jgi:inorganic pyrophosphatase
MLDMSDREFWLALDRLAVDCELVIDWPKGTAHPRYPAVGYPLDYGYLADTRAGDGEGIDVWVGSRPEWRVSGVICTVDGLQRDAEIKILLGCTPQEARIALATHNRGQQRGILVERDDEEGELG